MSKKTTVARPYAKAIFEFAIEHQNVAHWQSMLTLAAKVSCNKQVSKLFSRSIAPQELAKIFITVCGDTLDIFCQNLIRIMSENKRLAVLPNVLEQFILLRTSQEGTVEVDITSANLLKKEQLAKINFAIEQRLSRKVKLNCKINKSVITGIVIRIGDMVIDSSIRGRLNQLADVLQSY